MPRTVEQDVRELATCIRNLAAQMIVHVTRPDGADATRTDLSRIRDIAASLAERPNAAAAPPPPEEQKPATAPAAGPAADQPEEPKPEAAPAESQPAGRFPMFKFYFTGDTRPPLNGTHFIACPTCDGTGEVTYESRLVWGDSTVGSIISSITTVCSTCHGGGIV